MPSITKKQIDTFQGAVWEYYRDNKRELPWRDDTHPYSVLVSEIMLQQTQVSRVIPKFYGFMNAFPDIHDLANAPQSAIMQAWQGLGYNRRARFLHRTAQMVCDQYHGTVPRTQTELMQLPGIGANTAGSIAVFAYNQPTVFIETNIRSVFLHWFFRERDNVTDRDIIPIIESTLYLPDPRQWYWALMDFGVYLKQSTPNPSRKSRHHIKQTPFATSKRKVRGDVIRLLTRTPCTYTQISAHVNDSRLQEVLDSLEAEQLIVCTRGMYHLKE